MPYENLTAKLDDATVETIQTKIKEIRELLPFAIGLTPGERGTLPKITDASSFFVEDALAAAEANEALAPRYLDVPELRSDLTLWRQIDRFVEDLSALARTLEDTAMAAGSEAYVAALAFYNSVKRAARDGVPGAQSIEENLKRRFELANRPQTPPLA